MNDLIEEAHEKLEAAAADKNARAGKAARADEARAYMCQRYFDIRAFGAVLSTGEKNAGQVRGPVQLTFSRSIDPIVPLDHSITRMAVTRKEDTEKERTMGRKATVPYGLYRCHGFVSAALARQTGFSEEDLETIWGGLARMFEEDRSAARGLMSSRRLVVFKHTSNLGNAPAHALFERVRVARGDERKPPRGSADYDVLVDRNDLPEGVEIIDKL